MSEEVRKTSASISTSTEAEGGSPCRFSSSLAAAGLLHSKTQQLWLERFRKHPGKQAGQSSGPVLPAEALGNLAKAVDRKQEGCVAIATQTLQKMTRRSQTLPGGCVFCDHGDGVKEEVFQVVSELLLPQELQIWPTVVG